MQTFNIEVGLCNLTIVNEFIRQAVAREKGNWFPLGRSFIAQYKNGTTLVFVFPKTGTTNSIKISGTNGEVISKINKFCG